MATLAIDEVICTCGEGRREVSELNDHENKSRDSAMGQFVVSRHDEYMRPIDNNELRHVLMKTNHPPTQ